MEALPREILKEITKRLSLSSAACWAQTSKLFNTLIWSLITTLDEYDTRGIEETTILAKFNHLESLLLGSSVKLIPQDLPKLTTLQKVKVNESKESFYMLQTLKNLRELDVSYKHGSSKKLDELLTDHTRLTKLEISSDDIKELDPLSWKIILTRLRHLSLNANYIGDDKIIPAGFFSTLWALTQLRGLGLNNIILDQLYRETGLSKLSGLEELEIFGCKLRDESDREDWIFNYNELLDLKKLTSLDIMDVNLNQKLIDIITKMTQLVNLTLYESDNDYKLSPYSTLKNLTRIWFGLGIEESDPGLEFSQMTYLEVVSIPWCQNVTQLVHLKKLRELFLRPGSRKGPNDNQKLNFLSELDTVKELTVSASLLPGDGIVDMKGMTNLVDLEIMMYGYNLRKNNTTLPKFVEGLSVAPSLVSLEFDDNITQELLQIIATSLTQLKILKLPKSSRSLFRDNTTATRDEAVLPSHKDFSFRVKFGEY